MWFLFGFVTLIGCVAYRIHRELNGTWKGTPNSAEGIEYQLKIVKGKHGIARVKVAVDAPAQWYFKLKRESGFDQFCKRMGLAEEYQIGCDAFDHLIYIVSDNPHLAKFIQGHEAFRSCALEIFKFSQSYVSQTVSMHCQQGQLWLEAKTDRGFEECHADMLASKLAPTLAAIANALEQATCPKSQIWKDPFTWKAAALLGVSTGFAINGGVQLYRLRWGDIPFTIDTSGLLELGLLVGGGICAALVIFTLYTLGKSARTHLVLLELLTLGLFGCIATAYAELRDFNMEYDQSSPVQYASTVLSRTQSRTRRGGRKYYLYVENWHTHQGENVKIKVPSSLYRQAPINGQLKIEQREGRLGLRWVQNLSIER